MSFSLVIQGPLNMTSLGSIDKISDQFDSIIISYWDENNKSLKEYAKSRDTQVFSQKTPDRQNTFGVLKDSTFYFSICSTRLGIKNSKSKYTIKMRSDEFYSDFSKLKQVFLQDDEKLVFGNIFAKPWSHSPYHMGDHLFVAKTEYLVKGYDFLYNSYTTGQNLFENPWLIQGYSSKHTAESILAKSFLKSKNVLMPWGLKRTFLDNFDVVDINELGDYQARWVHGGKTYSNNSRFVWKTNKIEDF